jgi:hypothetical protein
LVVAYISRRVAYAVAVGRQCPRFDLLGRIVSPCRTPELSSMWMQWLGEARRSLSIWVLLVAEGDLRWDYGSTDTPGRRHFTYLTTFRGSDPRRSKNLEKLSCHGTLRWLSSRIPQILKLQSQSSAHSGLSWIASFGKTSLLKKTTRLFRVVHG